jgi:ABC-type nickel/cobalt efflux system permease component RcnA
MPLTVFISREVISRIVLIIMAVAVLSSSFMAKPQAAYSVQETTSISDHQHDSDEPLNEHDPLLFHSHGSVHHLNADHSHDLNKKLFALPAYSARMESGHAGDICVEFRTNTANAAVHPRTPSENPVCVITSANSLLFNM